jgi:polysaccharide biosynthesis/export protein
MRIIKVILFVIAMVLILPSCNTLNQSRMLKTPRGYEFTRFPDSTVNKTYQISKDDVLSLRMYSNNGFKPIAIGSTGSGATAAAGARGSLPYKVQSNGKVKIPILGEFKISGISLKEAEVLIEERLSKYYKDPFVILEVMNKRVYLFRGGSSAQVVNLQNDNTTLFEVLASAGGITGGGNAKRIKIIRGDLRNPIVYLIDLSKVESLPSSDLIMQANDIIYIDPVINFATNITGDIASILSLFSSILLVFNLINQS